jgi:hypothetical protein
MKLTKLFNMKLQKTAVLAAAMAMLMQVQVVHAQITNFGTSATLAQLTGIPGGYLTIGDKTFSGFSFTADNLTSFSAAGITVVATELSPSDYLLTWNGNISIVSGGPATGDLELNYTVAASDGLIFAIDQGYTGTVDAPGGGFLTVTENAYTPGSVVAAASSDLNQNIAGTSFTAIGAILSPAQPILNVTKDIGFAAVAGGFITISQVEQSFEQVTVPEPASFGLMLLGFGALVCTRRFKQIR